MNSKSYFPFFVDVTKLQGLVVGGGKIAAEKVERLMPFGARLKIVAPSICDEIRQYDGRITLNKKNYQKEDLQKAEYVIAATNDVELNRQVYTDAKARGLLINVVDVPELCDFIFPAVTKRGKLVVGVSSSGAGPRVAIKLRNDIEKLIPENVEEILDFLAEERIRAKKEILDPAERRQYLIELTNRLINYED